MRKVQKKIMSYESKVMSYEFNHLIINYLQIKIFLLKFYTSLKTLNKLL